MKSKISINATIPSHVPPELVVDYDYLYPEGFQEDIFIAFKRLHDGPDIFWTPRHGGHWVVTRGEDIKQILEDYEQFSSRSVFIQEASDRRGFQLK